MWYRSTASRRGVIAGMAAGAGGIPGCLGTIGPGDDIRDAVSLLAAGSLDHAIENGLRPAVDVKLHSEAHGSVDVARLVAEGTRDPDVVTVADVALFDGPLRPDWHVEFATNAVVLAYNRDTSGGERIANAADDRWYRPLLDGEVALGRTDPDLDPLGYRTLFVFDLATDHYGTGTALRAAIPAREQIYPETQLVSGFETGAIDAAVTYRNMAVERGYDYVDLPPEIDLSEPALADHYGGVTYELPDGTTVSGGPVSYGSTLRRTSPAAVDVFGTHTTGEYLTDFGFAVPDDYPRYTGDVPQPIAS